MATKTSLTIAEKIDRAKNGRTQLWIISKMNEILKEPITDVKFSRKKLGVDEFTPEEIATLSTVLEIDLSI